MQAEGDQLFVDQRRIEQDRQWWYQTAREVRESDEYKVRDYKEDIDTLLVIVSLGFLLTRPPLMVLNPEECFILRCHYSTRTRIIQEPFPRSS